LGAAGSRRGGGMRGVDAGMMAQVLAALKGDDDGWVEWQLSCVGV
jgi:hypothetical protein